MQYSYPMCPVADRIVEFEKMKQKKMKTAKKWRKSQREGDLLLLKILFTTCESEGSL
jgi:hypothetical protein